MKKLSKVLALVLTLAMVIGATLVTGVVTASADDVVVWEGTIDMDFTTKNTVAIINSDDSLTQAIRDDLAQNGPATAYTLTSADSYFVDGPSGYTVFGFYDEMTAATPDNYHEWWGQSEKGQEMTNVSWTDAADLALMGLKVSICLYSDGSGDTGHVGTIKLVATHSAGAKPVTTAAPQPSVKPEDIQNKQVLWTGEIGEDMVTNNTIALFKIDELTQAIRDDVAANGPAVAYVVEADAAYVSGDSGYASYLFYEESTAQTSDGYLECWADKGSNVNSAVFTSADLAKMGPKVQFGLACDTSGDVIHVNSLTLYVAHSGSFTVPSQASTEPSASQTEPSASQTEPSAVTEPSSATVTYGDANDDGLVNMKDVLLLRKLLADLPVEINQAAADYNQDGAVNMKDVLGLRKYIAQQ